MVRRADVIYTYDGSFTGLLCCVYESFYAREDPLDICPADTPALFARRAVATDADKAARVRASIRDKIAPGALTLVRDVFFSCAPQKEMLILHFLRFGYQQGARCIAMLSDPLVQPLYAARRFLLNEAHLLRGFVRFMDSGGALIACIEPRNFVLPYLQPHFCSRLISEDFMIYDKTHKAALLYQAGHAQIVALEAFTPPPADETERGYRALWKRFYDTIAIAARENPRLRMTHCPKRYWAHMCEVEEQLTPLPAAPRALPGGE